MLGIRLDADSGYVYGKHFGQDCRDISEVPLGSSIGGNVGYIGGGGGGGIRDWMMAYMFQQKGKVKAVILEQKLDYNLNQR